MKNGLKNLDHNIYNEIKSLIENSKKEVAKNINNIITITYWHIGKIIVEDELNGKERADYGKQVLKELSKKLTIEYGNGFSERNIRRMKKFYKLFIDFEIVATLSPLFSWSHFVEFVKIEDEIKREFYISMCKNERWSVRTLKDRVNSMLFERTAISKNPDITIKNDLKLLEKGEMSEDLFLKDPYILDFLELKDTYSEKDIESSILNELEKFILEFGNDFAFLSRQKRIQIGDNDYYLDLLFFHRKMRRLVLIELKLGKFEPQYKGQVELYLNWLNKYEKQEYENKPIALILCAEKENEEIELMGLDTGNIRVAEYWAELPPKEILEAKLHKAIEIARNRGKIDE
jgi:predicted nuclease of restriction endonuclease-like (RecB) superfamily